MREKALFEVFIFVLPANFFECALKNFTPKLEIQIDFVPLGLIEIEHPTLYSELGSYADNFEGSSRGRETQSSEPAMAFDKIHIYFNIFLLYAPQFNVRDLICWSNAIRTGKNNEKQDQSRELT